MASPYGDDPITHFGYSHTYYIDALLPEVDARYDPDPNDYDYKWGGTLGSGATITFSFPTATSVWTGSYSQKNEPNDGFQELTSAQQQAFRDAFQAWADVANIQFVEVPETSVTVGDIRVAASAAVTQDGFAVAWAYNPYDPGTGGGDPASGDIWIDPTYSENSNVLPGQYGMLTFVHEIGHALGLSHTFKEAPTDKYYLPRSEDSYQYSVMSYTADPHATIYPAGPMLDDIAVMQYLYGANTSFATGDDTYTFGSTEQLKAIWDAGGNDTFDVSDQTIGANINLVAGHFSSIGRLANNRAAVGNIAIAFGATIENAIGSNFADTIAGNEVANNLQGGGGNDTLSGGDGNDTLDGGIGADSMSGGKGDDTYIVDNPGDKVIEAVNQGNDTIELTSDYSTKAFSYVLAANVETLDLSKISVNATITGNAVANTFIGGSGDDTYILDSNLDQVTEDTGAGNDTIRASFLLSSLTANVENYTYTGKSDWTFSGDAQNNALTGGAGDDTLLGGEGDDLLDGGAGLDTASYADHGSIAVTVTLLDGKDGTGGSGAGDADTLRNIENVTGSDGGDTITGNSAANMLDGGKGDDVLTGGAGNDTYYVDSTDDQVVETQKGGTADIEIASVSVTLAAYVENLTLKADAGAINGTGNDLANIITGNADDNKLDGGIGADTLIGGKGNDTYALDIAGDKVTELAGQGIDKIVLAATYSSKALSYTIGANLENLDASALIVALTATGNAADNEITGSSSAANVLSGGLGNDALTGGVLKDTLDGGVGADTMTGGDGDDTYIIDNAGDVVVEVGGEGIDLIKSSVAINLSAGSFAGQEIENILLTGALAINATGNDLNNTITGNSAANMLTGGLGKDVIDGGAGLDTVSYADHGSTAPVTVTLLDGKDGSGGSDAADMDTLKNIENVTGSDGDDTITGNSAANVLDGGKGDDVLTGGAGNDTYYVDSTDDQVVETQKGGTDIEISSVTVTLAAYVENLTLKGDAGAIDGTGNDLANIITGNDDDNKLDGGIGADTLIGGKGNDTYTLDVAGDKVTELANQGNDTIVLAAGYSSKALSYTIGANLENLNASALIVALTATGNTADNMITGSSSAANLLSGGLGGDTLTGGGAKDTLDGGAGADTMAGGAGDDTYIVDNTGDSVVEVSGEGTDLIKSSVSIDLTSKNFLNQEIENILLTGALAINATGNDLKNVITGNSVANVISGGLGDDTIDTGAGADTILFNVGDGNDTVNGADAVGDTIKLQGTGLFDINFGWNGKDLYLAQAQDENFDFADTGKITVQNFLGGSGSLTVQIDTLINDEYGTDAKISTFTFQKGLTGTNNKNTSEIIIGTTANDVINGNGGYYDGLYGDDGNDTINGGYGVDALYGGNGNDVLNGFAGKDFLSGGAGYDILNGGDGEDIATYSVTNDTGLGIWVDLGLGHAFDDGHGYSDTLNGIEDVRGSQYDDKIVGDANNNALSGGKGDDTLRGGAGDDMLTGGDGIDTFVFDSFGEGNDTITDFDASKDVLAFARRLDEENNGILDDLKDNTATVVDEGSGKDVVVTFVNGKTLTLAGAGTGLINSIDALESAVQIVLSDDQRLDSSPGVGSGPLSPDQDSTSATVIGGSGNESITGTDSDDVLVGNAGNDTLTGGKGDDRLIGGAGNDTFKFAVGDGKDYLVAGTYGTGDTVDLVGTDFSDFHFSWDDDGDLYLAQVVNGNYDDWDGTGYVTAEKFLRSTAGSLTMQIDLVGDHNSWYTAGGGDARLTFVSGLTGTNNASSTEVIIGSNGNDVINGNGGYYDMLYGDDGNDTINGGSGVEFISGGSGNDTLNGLGGNDDLRGGLGSDTLNGGAGYDYADYGDTHDHGINVNLALGKALDDGDGGVDKLVGIEAIYGSAKDDVITGSTDSNFLHGYAGDDILDGGLSGGQYYDELFGGDGSDTFVVHAGSKFGKDVIADWEKGQDVLSFVGVKDVDKNGVVNLNDLISAITSITDAGSGGDVTVKFAAGGTLIFAGVGIGAGTTGGAGITNLVTSNSDIHVSA